jgi:hypothetical protein
MATKAKKAARKSPSKPAASKPAASKPAASKPGAATGTKPVRNAATQSNFCPEHGRLLRSDRTCPVSSCRFHDTPVTS